MLAIDNSGGPFDGSLYLTWFTFGGGVPAVMHVARSRDRGLTWTESSTIPGASGWPFIAVGADGSVYASYYDAIGNRIATVRSTDGGVTFGAATGIAPERTLVAGAIGYGTAAHQMAADVSSRATRGNLYVAFPCDADSAGHPPSSVCFTRSIDGGATWLAMKRLSPPTQEAGLPNVAVDATSGEVLLTWIARDLNSNDATLWATRSLNGGATLEVPHPVTSSFPSRQAAGDYNQSASVAAVRMAMFSDTNGHLSMARISYVDDPPLPAPPALPRRRAVK